jgi:hypothetical protein
VNRLQLLAAREDIRRVQLHLVETGARICRKRIMTGLRFLFRVNLRRLDLAAEIYHLREPQKIPLVMSCCHPRRSISCANGGRRAIEVSRLAFRQERSPKVLTISISDARWSGYNFN